MTPLPLLYSPSSGSSMALQTDSRDPSLCRVRSRLPVPDEAISHFWPSIREELRRAVSEPTWDLWLAALRPRSLDAGRLVLEAPAQSRGWVAERYGRLLQACASAVLGRQVSVVVDEMGAHPGDGAAESPPDTSVDSEPATAINPRLTFDQFVIGDSNRLAHAAALAVAELPGLAYNPLFICGAPGLGKTHLLHSIANYARLHAENLQIRLTSAEAFTNAFLGALHGNGDIEAFKAAHRSVDVLLVDDVQFLQSKARTEQEFFHLFNELHATGAQIVLTSDRPPRDMEAMEDRLRERFQAGLVCDVTPPDAGTRLTVLRKRALQDRLDLADADALELIAERVTDNIRTLEGALIRVVAFASLTGRPVTRELAATVLDDLYPGATRPPVRSVRAIQERICEQFGLALDDLLSPSRAPAVAWPRQLAMYLSRELTDESLPAIGAAFGGRSHTTVLHACRRATERLVTDHDSSARVDKLSRELRGLS
jgi:chromosomal replication initiator protein